MVDSEDDLFERWLDTPRRSDAETGDALFEQAMRDAAPAPAAAPPPAASPAQAGGRRSRRRLFRALERGGVTPQRDLDLHGMTRDAAFRAVESFLRAARRDGLTVVRIVSGIGLHSVAAPVLEPALGGWLRNDLRAHLWEALHAPPALGGRGATVVFLRPVTAHLD